MIRHPDILSGTVLAVAGAAVLSASLQIDVVQLDRGLDAAFFPALCGGVLAAIGAVIAIKGLFAARTRLPFVADGRVAAVAGLFLLYFFTFTLVDFRVGAWAMLLVSMLALGARGVKELVIVPVAVAACIYLLFRYGLQISVPEWI